MHSIHNSHFTIHIHEAVLEEGETARFADDEVGAFCEHNGHEVRRVERELETLSLRVRLWKEASRLCAVQNECTILYYTVLCRFIELITAPTPVRKSRRGRSLHASPTRAASRRCGAARSRSARGSRCSSEARRPPRRSRSVRAT